MLTFSNLQVPPPANWQDFEKLCWDLWKKIWEDPSTLRNGRQGQPQQGVDVYGRPQQGNRWAGVQCKGKDNYTNQKLTEKEVLAEVKKAQSFKPKLSEFIIATTEPKNARIEELARTITKKNLEEGLFSVHIFFWKDIIDRLENYPNIITKYYPGLSLNARMLEKEINEIEKPEQESFESTEMKLSVSSSPQRIETPQRLANVDISTAILTPEYKAELDDVQDLIDNYKPEEALQHLEKLEKRWLNPPESIKYRLLVYMARAKLYLNQDHDAAKLLIKAWQYNSEEDKAFSNRALGHLLLNQKEKAREYAKMALEKNPASSHAYSILAQTFSDEEKLEDIITQIPDHCRTTPEVAHTLGHLARRRGNFAEARKWLEIAIENNIGDLSDFEAELGEVLLESVMEDISAVYMKQLSDFQKKQVQEALRFLTSAWQRVDNTGIRNCRISWIASRGLAKRLLGDTEGAIKDFEIALSIKPSDPTFMINRAVLAYENNDNETAISLAKQILLIKETPEAVSLLAYALDREGRFSEAIEILEDILKSSSTEDIKREANRLLILHYVESKDFLAAKNISDSLRAADPENVLYLVDAACISRMSGNPEEAILFLKEAAKQITDSSPIRWLIELADEFYFLRQYDVAINFYEKIVDKSAKTPFTYRLLDCYYHSGKHDYALEICQTLRRKYGPLESVSEMEVAIYESIGDLVEAKNVCKEYLNEFPKDFRMKLRLAMINFRSNNFEELDEFLNSSVNIDKLPIENGFLLARLYAARDLVKKAFETIYEVRRNFPNDGNAHVNYVIFFFSMEKDSCEWLRVGTLAQQFGTSNDNF